MKATHCRWRTRWRVRKFGAILGVCLLSVGCARGPDKVEVAGDVSFDGQPIAEGTLALTPIDGTSGPQTGGAIRNGHYELRGKAAPRAGGAYRVEISNIVPSGRKIQVSANPNVPPVEAMENTVPAEFNIRSTLTLRIPVDVDSLRHDFHLTVPASQTTLAK